MSYQLWFQVGGDYYGQRYLENLKKCNVNIDYVSVTDKADTGVAAIAVDDKGIFFFF